MAVRFVFAASKAIHSVPVSGDSISLGQLKDEIYDLKFKADLAKRRVHERFDFQVYDGDTKEEIVGAHTRIPNHSSVIVKRVPAFVVHQQQRQLETIIPKSQVTSPPSPTVIDDGFGDDVYSTPSAPVLPLNSDTNSRESGRNSTGTCWPARRASKKVHPIDAPKTTNIEKQKVTSERQRIPEAARVERVVSSFSAESVAVNSDVQVMHDGVQIPEELACSLCHDIMNDPVLIPCCCITLCRACVTSAFLVDQKCPKCKSSKCKVSDLLSNRHMKNLVHSFMMSNGLDTSDSASTLASSKGSNEDSGQHVAGGDNGCGGKRKFTAPCSSLDGRKKRKPLVISLSSAKATAMV